MSTCYDCIKSISCLYFSLSLSLLSLRHLLSLSNWESPVYKEFKVTESFSY